MTVSNSFQNSSLEGKIAVITGSTQGLGEATARLFKERGAKGIIITGRNAERGNALAADLTGDGCTAHFIAADLANVNGCRSIINAADEHFGTLHILVNSGALTVRGTIWDTTPELYDQMMAINTRAPFFLMQEAIRIMERDNVEASIVNISSVASYGSLPMLAPYAISKGALNIATKNIAYAVSRSRIRVNALALGWMDTPGEDLIQRKFHSDGEEWLAAAEASQPFGRLLKMDEVARCIAYCASNESGMMTGCIIDFDQSVFGAGPQPIAPPKDEWDAIDGVSFSF